jgi:hypothetical protein
MNMLMSGAARHCIPWFRDMCRDKTNVINLLEAAIYTTEHITILKEVLIDFILRDLLSESGIVRVRTFARMYAFYCGRKTTVHHIRSYLRRV